jgi:hypothetical protein
MEEDFSAYPPRSFHVLHVQPAEFTDFLPAWFRIFLDQSLNQWVGSSPGGYPNWVVVPDGLRLFTRINL